MKPAAHNWHVEDYLSYLLARASHAVSSEFHHEVRQAGFSVLEWRVLATLSDGQARPVGELSRIVLAQQPTLTKLLGRLESIDLVTRAADDSDRRVSLICISAKGRRALGDLLERSKEFERRACSQLDSAEVRALKLALRKLIAVVG